jgi:hypothetical protein
MLAQNELYVVGGQARSTMFRKLDEWHSCQRAVVIQMAPESGKMRTGVEYVSPPQVLADDSAAVLFKSASLQGNRLYTCTSTEVLIYELPEFRLLHYVSHPCFNDLHHVCPTPEGTLLVAVTGLDMVVEITVSGRILREWNVLGEDTWQRFSRETDYRKVLTTKPHQSHPNHVFHLDDEIWVTRFRQRDAISLTAPGRRIDIAVQLPHDGLVTDDSIYFTTVDGQIVRAGRKSLKVEQVFDLNQVEGSDQQVRGWCRGLLPVSKTRFWVGFSYLRPTKFRENLSWITSGSPKTQKHSHIALFDMAQNRCIHEIPLERHGVDVIFSLLEVPAVLTSSGR